MSSFHFQEWLRLQEVFDDNGELKPQDIYNFYYVTILFQEGSLSAYGKSIAIPLIKGLKQKYIRNLVPLVQEQLYKYLKRGRLDPGAYERDHVTSASPGQLDDFMRATYRSDMKRRNTVWESLTGNLKALAAAISPNDVIHYIDRVNNDIHNTGELVLTKLPGGYKIADALNVANNANPKQLRGLVDKDLRDLE